MSGSQVQEGTIETTVLGFLRSPTAPEAEVVGVRMVGGTFRPHSHDCYSVTISDAGFGRLILEGAVHDLPAGAVGIIAPDQVHSHSAQGSGEWRFRTLYLSNIQRPADRQHHGRQIPAQPVLNRPSIFHRLDLGLKGDDLELNSVLRRLLTGTCETPTHPLETAAERICEVLDVVRRRPDENWTPDRMAEAARMSVSTLNRYMKRYYGIAPMRYLHLQRVHAVRRKLREGWSLGMLADQYQFADTPHLVRCFGAVFGVSPGRYQRRVLGFADRNA